MTPLDPPKHRVMHELVVATAKGAISAIPVFGGLLAEYAGVLSDTIRGRAERWEIAVTEALNEIQGRFSRLPDDLFRDEAFVTSLQLASFVAMRESGREKVDLLKQALISAASGKYEPFSQEQLMRQLDGLTPEHVQVLSWLCDAHDLSSFDSMEDVYAAFVTTVPSADRQTFRSLINDLDGRFLIVTADVSDYDEYESKRNVLVDGSSGRQGMLVTPLGKRFVEFIYAA